MKPPVVMEHIKPAHIECTKDDLASTVIMPGDPLRAQYIAEKYLNDAKLVSRARNMFAYTGTYKGNWLSMPEYRYNLWYSRADKRNVVKIIRKSCFI